MAIEAEDAPRCDAPTVTQSWRMQTPDGAVYGPVSLLTLCNWAMDARVTPGCRVACDGRPWRAAETMPLLGLEWNLVLESGAQYGPLHFLALHELAREIPKGVQSWLVHRPSGERWPYSGPLAPDTVREFRERLASQMREAGRAAGAGDAAALRAATEERDRLRAELQALKSANDVELRRLAGEVARITQKFDAENAAAKARQDQAEQAAAASLAQAETAGRARLNGLQDELRQLRDRLAAGETEREAMAARLKIQDTRRDAAETQLAAAIEQARTQRAELDLSRRRWQDEAQKLREAATARAAEAQAAERDSRAAGEQAGHELDALRAQLLQRETHLADVLREQEAREAVWRRKCEAQAAAQAAPAAERVIEVEYERHAAADDGQTVPAPAAAEGEPPRMASRDVLAGLEARLQAELTAWEQMHQTKKRR